MPNQPVRKRDDDQELEALLDEALSARSVPGGVPDDLTERIVAQTADRLQAQSSGVLARIGPARIRAVAAVLILAATIGIMVVVSGLSGPTDSLDPQIDQALAQTLSYEPVTDDIDREIQLLATAIDEFGSLNLADATTTSIDDDLAEFEAQYSGESLLF